MLNAFNHSAKAVRPARRTAIYIRKKPPAQLGEVQKRSEMLELGCGVSAEGKSTIKSHCYNWQDACESEGVGSGSSEVARDRPVPPTHGDNQSRLSASEGTIACSCASSEAPCVRARCGA